MRTPHWRTVRGHNCRFVAALQKASKGPNRTGLFLNCGPRLGPRPWPLAPSQTESEKTHVAARFFQSLARWREEGFLFLSFQGLAPCGPFTIAGRYRVRFFGIRSRLVVNSLDPHRNGPGRQRIDRVDDDRRSFDYPSKG